MGTRHLISVVSDGVTRIAQYGQWDGYPTGQGTTIAEFLAIADLDEFRRRLAEVTFIDNAELLRQREAAGFVGEWLTWEEGQRLTREFPAFSRDTCADILHLVCDGTVTEVYDSSSFAEDTVWCEFAYTIDLDTETVTVVGGEVSYRAPFDKWTPEAMPEVEAIFWPEA